MDEASRMRQRRTFNHVTLILMAIQAGLAIAVGVLALQLRLAFMNDFNSDTPWRILYQNSVAIFTTALVTTASPFRIHVDKQGHWYFKVWLCTSLIFIGLWAGAVGTSFFTCADLCSANPKSLPLMTKLVGHACQCAADTSNDNITAMSVNLDDLYRRYIAIQCSDAIILASMVIGTIVTPFLSHIMITPKPSQADPENAQTVELVQAEDNHSVSSIATDTQLPAYEAGTYYENEPQPIAKPLVVLESAPVK